MDADIDSFISAVLKQSFFVCQYSIVIFIISPVVVCVCTCPSPCEPTEAYTVNKTAN